MLIFKNVEMNEQKSSNHSNKINKSSEYTKKKVVQLNKSDNIEQKK